MLMHVWYRLHLAPATFAEAIQKIEQLRAYALSCGFIGAHDGAPVDEIEMGTDADDRPRRPT